MLPLVARTSGQRRVNCRAPQVPGERCTTGRSRFGVVTGVVSVVAAGVLPALLPESASGAPRPEPPAVAYPAPGDGFAALATDLTLRGVNPGRVGGLTVTGSAAGAHPGTLSALQKEKGRHIQSGHRLSATREGHGTSSGRCGGAGPGDEYTFTAAKAGPRSTRRRWPEEIPIPPSRRQSGHRSASRRLASKLGGPISVPCQAPAQQGSVGRV